jgi:transcription antitermination factor NusG
MTMDNNAPRWYSLQVRPNHERSTGLMLQSKGYDTFVPMYRSRRIWSDRVKEIELPVLAGYVFCRFQLNDRRVSVNTTPGVIRIVGVGNRPEPLEEHEILALQRADHSGLIAGPCPYLKSGSIMRICQGSLSGLEGIYVYSKNSHRVVISVTMLQRSVAVDVDLAWLEPIVARDSRPPRLYMETAK